MPNPECIVSVFPGDNPNQKKAVLVCPRSANCGLRPNAQDDAVIQRDVRMEGSPLIAAQRAKDAALNYCPRRQRKSSS